ncbi:DUF3068 domain-containing protein [Nocardioides mesophilus]|uniref:DUF3068 domain-containing protein n=1 Tax=Nocardioides mesophilus TaxID=433659 RepID=A0A7G9RBQ7_9ACTN|nr:DUF3068 domain-containing protein [Nocardioides mesophilus]QNN53032.1 DUF3068 domain-containing protein [Nocardioides mesophilus]
MRRIVGLVLVGLGMFLLVLAPLARFYAYPKLAVAPYDQNTLTVLNGPGATVFDIASLSEIRTDLTTTAKTVGDLKASEDAPDGVTVWVNTSSTKDSKGVVRSRSIDRAAFDQNSGEAVNCCGEFYETVEGEQQPVRHEGLVFKFPFNTQKQTYQWWDTSLLKAVPIKFERVEDVNNVTTYKFVQTIEPTVTGTAKVPPALVGAKGSKPVKVERVYANERALWVEPRTGVVFDRVESQRSTLRYQGKDVITTTAVDTSYSDATIRSRIDKYEPLGNELNLVRNTVPLIALIAGLLLVVIGAALALTGRGRHVDDSGGGPRQDEPAPAGVA